MALPNWARPFFIQQKKISMKPIKIMFILMLFSIFMVAASSCLTVRQAPAKKNQPRGWFKNSNNPHHPRTTNPGHNKWKKSKKHKSD
jgi:hypothetical protein